MTAQQIFIISPLIQKFFELKLPIKKAYQIYSLIKKIDEKKDFLIKKEKQMIEEYDGIIEEDGKISFKNNDIKNKFWEEHSILLAYSFDDDEFEVIELSLNTLKGIELTPIEIAQLESIINFVD